MKKIINNKYFFFFLLFFYDWVAFAHDCSSPGDCEETAGYNSAVAIVGGVIAVTVGVMSSGMTANEPPTDEDDTSEDLEDIFKDEDLDGFEEEVDDIVEDLTDEDIEDLFEGEDLDDFIDEIDETVEELTDEEIDELFEDEDLDGFEEEIDETDETIEDLTDEDIDELFEDDDLDGFEEEIDETDEDIEEIFKDEDLDGFEEKIDDTDEDIEGKSDTDKDNLITEIVTAGGFITEENAETIDKIKGTKSIIEKGGKFLKEALIKSKIDLQDIHSLKTLFDKNGDFIINNADDLDKVRKALKKTDSRIKKVTVSKKAQKIFGAASIGLEVIDGINRVQQVYKERGYTEDDATAAIGGEVAHKVAVILITKNPIIGAVDAVVSVINPKYNVEGLMRIGENAWHKTTKEYFDNIYNNSDKISEQLNNEFNRHKERIMKQKISKEEKLKRIKKLYKILLR